MSALIAEVTRDVERLQQTRSELVAMLDQAAPTDVPLSIARRVEGLPPVERALVVVLSRVLAPEPLQAYLDLLPPYRAGPAVQAFDALPPDADGARRESVAAGVADHLGVLAGGRAAQIRLSDDALPRSGHARRTVDEAVGNLYNAAQLDVLGRAQRRLGRFRS
ncbi:hypothetical protein [Pseudonocardia sp. ICBG1293]|uniref:hypothetical protein n=1 Tax=Pseudonocardia sp. ICBG1293 TaxID=2844382 RepID=UPI001CCBFA3D|nr:hypothetical protein [Pseudonocardia sp. ICBG1293]